jgi:hypothetical protein
VAYSPPSCGVSKGHDRQCARPRHGPALELGSVAWGAVTASRMQLRRCGESSGRGTDDADRTVSGGRRASPGSAADPIAALAMAGAGHRIDVGVSAGSWAPTTQRTIVVGRFGLPRSRAVGSLSVTAPAGVGGRPCRGAGDGRSGSHGPAAPIAFSEPGRPPYGARGRASLCPSRTTGSDLSRSQFRFRQNASNIPIHETAPSSLNDGYPAENL